MKSKKCLILVLCLTLLMSVMTGCGGSDNSDTLTSGKKTITVNYINSTGKFKNVTFYDYISQREVTITGDVYFSSGLQKGAKEAVFTYKKQTYAAKIAMSNDYNTLKIYRSNGKYDTYKKK